MPDQDFYVVARVKVRAADAKTAAERVKFGLGWNLFKDDEIMEVEVYEGEGPPVLTLDGPSQH